MYTRIRCTQRFLLNPKRFVYRNARAVCTTFAAHSNRLIFMYLEYMHTRVTISCLRIPTGRRRKTIVEVFRFASHTSMFYAFLLPQYRYLLIILSFGTRILYYLLRRTIIIIGKEYLTWNARKYLIYLIGKTLLVYLRIPG